MPPLASPVSGISCSTVFYCSLVHSHFTEPPPKAPQSTGSIEPPSIETQPAAKHRPSPGIIQHAYCTFLCWLKGLLSIFKSLISGWFLGNRGISSLIGSGNPYCLSVPGGHFKMAGNHMRAPFLLFFAFALSSPWIVPISSLSDTFRQLQKVSGPGPVHPYPTVWSRKKEIKRGLSHDKQFNGHTNGCIKG